MFGWLALLIGLAYGFFTPGQQDLKVLLKKGIVIGIVVGLILAVLGFIMDFSILGLGGGIVWAVISGIVVALIFVLGVWLGDLIEKAVKKPKSA